MALKAKISARAAGEIVRAADWWLIHRPSAPGAIGADFGEAVALLSEQPGLGTKYGGLRVAGVRRLFLRRVGYFIYYRADAIDLNVLAFWHASREHQPVL